MSIPLPPVLPARRAARRFRWAVGMCFLALLVLIAAFYLEENWRGARAWAACQRDLQAQGERLDWAAFIPPPVPDERNLAMAPLFVRSLGYRADPKTGAYTFGLPSEVPDNLKDMPFGGPKPSNLQSARWDLAKRTDLSGYQRFYRQAEGFPRSEQPQSPEAEVLLALSRYAPALEELAQDAVARPLTRFPVDWHEENIFGIRMPHYTLEQQLVSTLRLRACAQLALSHSDDALRDLELCFRLCQGMREDPNLIAHLVQCACLNATLTSVWEGLADRRWPSAELVRLQASLQRVDMLADYLSALRGERAFSIKGIDYHKNRNKSTPLLSMFSSQALLAGKEGRFTPFVSMTIPRGWFDLNKALLARFEQDYYLKAVDLKTRRVFPDKLAAGSRALQAMRPLPTNFMARFMLPVMESVSRRSAKVQTNVDQAMTACALERFFLDRQAYPTRLAELVPAYLERIPTDVIDGAPLRYRSTSDGRYQLYSIGWNGRDDGGQVVRETSRRLKDQEGDWVWQYADLTPPAPSE
jgi:hypothetical protein